MNITKGNTISFEVLKLALGGKGIGKIELAGRELVTFVEGAVPGDIVEAEITAVKRNYLEAALRSIVKASETRISPRCRHFGVCGGCSWQQLSYKEQLRYKENQVGEILKHIGGLNDVEVKPIIGCDEPWFYRNKMEYSFGYNSDGNFSLGLHLKKRRFDIFNLQECFLQSEESVRICEAVRDFCVKHNLQPYHFGRGEGLLRSLFVREGKNTGEILINLAISDEEFALEKEFVEVLKKLGEEFLKKNAESYDKKYQHAIVSIYLTRILTKKGRRTELHEKLLFGNRFLEEEMTVAGQKMRFHIQPQAFFQPNTRQAERLYEVVCEFSGSNGVILDLYCGTGTIGLFLAKNAEKVYGIELNEKALQDARANAELNGVKNIEFVCADCEKGLNMFQGKADNVVLDPPRAGLTSNIIEKIVALRPERIVYVSCNPATLARDLKILDGKGYRCEVVQPVDMFPQTYHIECVAKLILEE